MLQLPLAASVVLSSVGSTALSEPPLQVSAEHGKVAPGERVIADQSPLPIHIDLQVLVGIGLDLGTVRVIHVETHLQCIAGRPL